MIYFNAPIHSLASSSLTYQRIRREPSRIFTKGIGRARLGVLDAVMVMGSSQCGWFRSMEAGLMVAVFDELVLRRIDTFHGFEGIEDCLSHTRL